MSLGPQPPPGASDKGRSAPTPVSRLPEVGTTIFTVMSKLASDSGAVNLGQGFPDFNPDPAFEASLVKHMRAGHNQYAPMAGVPRLQGWIAQKLNSAYGCALSGQEDITVTAGATEGIFSTIASVVHPGDEVVVFDPSYDCYEPAITLQGGVAVHVPLGREFGIDHSALSRALSSRTALVIINFPHNPSGALLSVEDLTLLAEQLRPHRALLLSDEVYEHIVFDGGEHQSVLRHPELAARSFVVSSFGKSHHTTGWKVGWVAAPERLTHELRKVHQFVTFSVCHPAQHAFADLLEHHPSSLTALPGFYQQKRDLFRELMGRTRFELLPARSTYFQLADYSSISEEADTEFSRRLCLDFGVGSIPISVFCEKPREQRLIRFCFCKHDATLGEAARRLQRV